MDSKSCAAPLGGGKTGKNPTDRGKLGAKINLIIDERGAPISVVLTGANRHDKVSAIDLIASIILKRPVGRGRKQQHMCADKAYDAARGRQGVRRLRRLLRPHQGQPQEEQRRPGFGRGASNERRLLELPEGSSGEEVDGGAHDLVVEQAAGPPHALVEEGRELADVRSARLRSHLAQSGGSRIES